MSKFVKKVGLFLLVLFVTAALLFTTHLAVLGNQFESNYQAGLIDKVNRLESIDEPKIVLIGNSNVCFGIDSAMIEAAFGMPVVDMGLHGGLGNAFHENMAKLRVSEGDVIIVMHSTYADDDSIGDADLAWITLEFHPELWKLVRAKDIPVLVRNYPVYLLKALRNYLGDGADKNLWANTSYERSAFNKYGDIAYRTDDSFEFTEGSIVLPEINATCIDRLNNLNDYISGKGATLLIASYPIGYGEFTPSSVEYDVFESELKSRVNCDVISHYTDYFISYGYFYDTSLHLSEEGARIRTRQLIDDLSTWMEDHQPDRAS